MKIQTPLIKRATMAFNNRHMPVRLHNRVKLMALHRGVTIERMMNELLEVGVRAVGDKRELKGYSDAEATR